MPDNHCLLLGPQSPESNLAEALSHFDLPDGPVAVISAGWQEAEGDLDELRPLINRPLIDLRLWARAEEMFIADRTLWQSYRARQEQLKELQRLYRLRLQRMMTATRQLLRSDSPPELLEGEQQHAIEQLQALDRHHLERVERIHADFDLSLKNLPSDSYAEQYAAIAKDLEQCDTVVITGGNILVLLNRLRLFGLHHRLSERHLIAWSAGAMALSDMIVLFHDRTPEGRRDAEVLGAGVGVVPGFVFMPNAEHRLKANDKVRMELFGRRFAPAKCVTLDNGSALTYENWMLKSAQKSRRIIHGGRLMGLRA